VGGWGERYKVKNSCEGIMVRVEEGRGCYSRDFGERNGEEEFVIYIVPIETT
jgi:hypothetical protein